MQAALKLTGHVRIEAFRRGRYLYTVERDNLVVTAHAVPTSKLLGGTVSNQSIGAIGFGSGTTAPALTDTTLTTSAYYKAIGAVTYPSSGQVTFAWSLGSGDSGADGITIGEIGLFCNTGAVSLPATGTPSMTLFAHALLGLGSFSHSVNSYTGTWTLNC